MIAGILSTRPSNNHLRQVRTLADLQYLVKESEIVTGKPGRKFLVCGADLLAYRIAWLANGYQVQRLDAADNTLCTMFMHPHEIGANGIGDALRGGQLFTRHLQG